MKRIWTGAIVGGLIIFLWQFLSFALVNLHRPAQDYTEKQGAILEFLKSQNLPEGGYVLPNYPENASQEEMKKSMEEAEGKPWAVVQYHHQLENDMVMNMIRGVLVNILTVLLFCWIVSKMANPAFSTILLAALATGLIVFFNAPYTNHIWYETFDIWAHLADAIIAWGLVGLWLGWWLTRRRNAHVAATRTTTV